MHKGLCEDGITQYSLLPSFLGLLNYQQKADEKQQLNHAQINLFFFFFFPDLKVIPVDISQISCNINEL